MVTLPDNTVLVIGGENGGRYTNSGGFPVFASCEIFSPITRTWTTTGSMAVPRFLHRATLLPSGKVHYYIMVCVDALCALSDAPDDASFSSPSALAAG